MRRRVLVVGAGIAGTGLACWLGRDGHEVTLIDRVPAFVPRGHFMTLKGACVDALAMLGVVDALRECEWPSQEWQWFTSGGRLLRRASKSFIESILGGFIAVRRADLHRVLYGALPANVDVRWGTEIETLEENAERVAVTLSNGAREEFDAVVAADGIHSRMRERHFPDVDVRDLGGHYIVFAADCEHGLAGRTPTIWGQGSSVSLIPLSDTRVGAMIYQDDAHAPPPLDGDPQMWRAYLERAYADHPAWVRQAFAALRDHDDVFADRILMVPSTRLVSARTALLGDAGYCPTFFSGMGAAAALLGAYSLAAHLGRGDAVPDALRRYEQRLVPLTRELQTNALSGRGETLARGARHMMRCALAAVIPDVVGTIATRLHYRSEVDLAALA